MNEWMLTQTEWTKAYQKGYGIRKQSYRRFESAANMQKKAQAKKLLDWLEKEGMVKHTYKTRFISGTCGVEENGEEHVLDCRLCQLRKELE